MKKTAFHLLLIAIGGILIYSNTLNAPFIFDDQYNIVENYKLRDCGNLWPLSGSRWFGYLTFALNYKLGGLNVTGYHIVNSVIHILNAILVYYLVILTFKTPYFRNHSVTVLKYQRIKDSDTLIPGYFDTAKFIALFSAILFVSHPIQTQAVTYVVQRFTSLATLFYLLSLVIYIKFRVHDARCMMQDTPPFNSLPARGRLRGVFYLVSLISAILAMKTKEIAFTLPVIITLYEFMFFDGKIKKRILYLIPILLTMLIIPLSLMDINKPIGDVIGELREAAQETEEIPRWSYLLTQFRVIVTYIRLLFLPVNQNLDYDYPVYHSFLNPQVFLCFMFLLLIFAFAIYLFYASRITHHLSRLISFGIFWFFLTLSVESSVIPIRDVVYEHRGYLSSVGFFSALISLIAIINHRLKNRIALIEKTVIPLVVLMIITLSVTTYARNTVWQDKVSLWEDVVIKSPNKVRPHHNLGGSYDEQGYFENAIKEFQTVLRLKPDYAEAYYNLGNVYFDQRRLNDAIIEYQTALRLKPDYAEAHSNLGYVYYEKGNIDGAIEEFQFALRINPDLAEAHYNLGNVYYMQRRIDEAVQEYQIAIHFNPDFAEVYNSLGTIYSNLGRMDEALKTYQTAIRLKPDFAEAYSNLGTVYSNQGRLDEALKAYQMVLRFKPDYAEAHYNLGNTYFRLGQMNEALKEYQTAIRLKPDFAEAYSNLGTVYSNQGRLDEALKAYQMVLRFKPDYAPARYNLEMLYKAMKSKQ